MIFAGEKEFEDFLRRTIDSRILSENERVRVLEGKGIGDIVIARDGASPALFFLEVKYYRESHGRLGVGHRKGHGMQPEILSVRPDYLESHLRWVIASDAHRGQYWLLTSDVVCRFLSGGGVGSKQNNIRPQLFRECVAVGEGELVEAMKRWLSVH